MATGYEAIDQLQNQTNQMYNQQQDQQNKIIDIGTQQAVDELERNKQKTDQELLKTNRALYTDYQKQINPYGVNAERLAEQGLANSGLAETTKANYYNTYQTARTEATNNANTIKADFDADIVKARQNGDIQKAQSALELYKQKIADLSNFYNLRFNVDQFNYQKQRDSVADSQWKKEYDLSKSQWDKQFKYQKSRDKVADKQWLQQFNLTKKKTGSSGSGGRRSSGSRYSSGSKGKSGNTTLSTKDGSINNNSKRNSGNSKAISSSAQRLYDSLSKSNRATNEAKIQMINNAYKSGGISSSDVKLLVSKLGLS
jgi:hypothetical protein